MLNGKHKLNRQKTQKAAQKFQAFETLTDSEAQQVTGGFTFDILPFDLEMILSTSVLKIEF
ncbi:hypothetical protein [Chlorogloeopsis sp. ULAP02]|uniref:hypothetical protein n=1 Tax=Chlorogloeopsis sp. ULAP02 TaxID=3107926 RepID=UPI0031353C93